MNASLFGTNILTFLVPSLWDHLEMEFGIELTFADHLCMLYTVLATL